MDTRKLLIWLFLLTWGVHSQVDAKEIAKKLYKVDELPAISEKQGYLMVYVNVDGIAPSLNIAKVDTKNTDFVVGKTDDFTKKYRVELKQKAPGFYFIPMFSGVYQVTRVNAPFYDLPYWLDTDNQADWRFAIVAGKVNFAGEIYIAKERGTLVIDVHLFNHFAIYHEQIFKEMEQVPSTLSFAVKPGYQDDFFKELEK